MHDPGWWEDPDYLACDPDEYLHDRLGRKLVRLHCADCGATVGNVWDLAEYPGYVLTLARGRADVDPTEEAVALPDCPRCRLPQLWPSRRRTVRRLAEQAQVSNTLKHLPLRFIPF